MLMKRAPTSYLNSPPPPQPTPLTMLMKRALPQPQPPPPPQPTPLTIADEKSTASNVPIAAFESSNLISSNSTTTDDLEKNNETGFIK